MKKIYLIFLTALLSGTYFLNAQDYNFNNYKYRFQKLRGFELGLNNFNTNIWNENVTNEDKADTGIINKDKNNDIDLRISLGLNAYYFQNLNIDNLQQSINFYFVDYTSISKDFIKSSYNNNSKNKYSYINRSSNTNLGFSILNRYYNPSNEFKYLNLNTRNHLNVYRYGYKSINSSNSNILNEYERQNNSMRLNSFAVLEFGFGKGRLEYVTDPIMATFLIKELIEKADIKNVSNEQIENIAKGMTKIRNTRFIDFRFTLIDQIEMLDEVLKQNGIESNKTAKYYTSIYDNWLYATQKQRLSGNRWTYYFKNENDFYRYNSINNNYDLKADTNLDESKYLNKSINTNNGFSIDYETSIQKSLSVQKSKGFNIFVFHRWHDSLRIYDYKFGTRPFSNSRDTFNNQSLNIRIEGRWAHLFQPNTRTYLEFSVNPGFSSQKFLKDKRNGIEESFNKLNNNVFLGMNLQYFRFINARLNFTVWASTNSSLNLTNFDKDKDKIIRTAVLNLGSYFNLGARVSYFIF